MWQLGSNMGDTVQRFYRSEPSASGYGAALRRAGTSDPFSFCVYSFEANEKFQSHLEATARSVHKRVERSGGSLVIYNATAAVAASNPDGDSVTFYRGSIAQHQHGASTVVAEKQYAQFYEQVTVRAIRFPEWLAIHTPDKGQRPSDRVTVALKCDIEGAEVGYRPASSPYMRPLPTFPVPTSTELAHAMSQYEILRELVSSGLACSRLDHLFIEWHRKDKLTGNTTVPYEADGMLEWLLATPQCGVTVERLKK